MADLPALSLVYAICPRDPRHFAEGYPDIRDAPTVCPVCESPLVTACARCGTLYRNPAGLCTNCGYRLNPPD